jgi:hypothetical protein
MRAVHHMAMIAGLCMTACAPVTTLARNDATTTPDLKYVTLFVLQGDSSGSPIVDRQRKKRTSISSSLPAGIGPLLWCACR